MADVALYTTVHPGVMRWVPDWWRSVEAQTDREVTIWIGLDGVERSALPPSLAGRDDVRWVVADRDTPATLRERAMRAICDEHEAVIFVDSDDELADDRIATAREALRDADVTACAMELIDTDGAPVGAMFTAGGEPAAELGRWNVFGLSNTAYRCDMLERCLPVTASSPLVDWLLATRAWGAGARMRFTAEPGMRYRQHARNIARLLPPFTADYVREATHLVRVHHDGLLSDPTRLSAQVHRAVARERQRVIAFQLAITRDAALLDEYTTALNSLLPRLVWWWCVANPELEELWAP